MGEEFHAIIKLVSGEEIFALVSVDGYDDDPIIILQNPVSIKMMHMPNGHFIKVKPWIELTEEDLYMIKLDKIITMTESKDEKLIAIYNNYIEDEKNDKLNDGLLVKISDKMGYISTVEDARKNLEDLFKLKSKES